MMCIGTDVAGSVRVPAHFSGIYTVRCATGRFPKSGNSTSMAGQEVNTLGLQIIVLNLIFYRAFLLCRSIHTQIFKILILILKTYRYSPMARTFEDLLYFFKSYFSMKPWTYDHHVHPIPWREEEYKQGKGKLRWGVMRDDGELKL